MQPPKIENSTKEERQAYVIEAWKCLHDCEACGKCRILKGRDAEHCMPTTSKASGVIWTLPSRFGTAR